MTGACDGRDGHDLPFLVAGGGIGGLVAAYGLARKGFAVRLFEQAAEFKELGAGIQRRFNTCWRGRVTHRASEWWVTRIVRDDGRKRPFGCCGIKS